MQFIKVIDFSFFRLNAAWFSMYLVLCVIHSVVLAKSAAYHAIIHEAWFERYLIINPYSSIAFIMNLTLMRRHLFGFSENRLASAISYLAVMFALSQAWYWLSVLPAFFTYLASGGIPG